MVNWGEGCAQMSSGPERVVRQVVDADAVLRRVNDVMQLGFEDKPLRGIADDLEDGLLDAVAISFACLRDPAKPTFSFPSGGVDVVGDEQFHLAQRPGQMGVAVAAEVTRQQARLDKWEQRSGDVPAESGVVPFALPGC